MKVLTSSFDTLEFKINYVTKQSEVAKALELLSKVHTPILGLDIETAKVETYKEHKRAGLCPLLSRIRLIQFWNGYEAFIFDLFDVDILSLGPFLRANRFVAHNGKFEILHLTHAGFPDLNIDCSLLLSTLTHNAEHSPFETPDIDDEEDEGDGLTAYKRAKHGLSDVAERLFKIRIPKDLQKSDWSTPELSPEQLLYAALDSVLTWKIAKTLGKRIQELGMVNIYRLLKDMQHVAAEIELAGFPVDWEQHARLAETWRRQEDAALHNLYPFIGDTNPRSSKQMGKWLEEYALATYTVAPGCSLFLNAWPKTPSGAYSFNKTTLAAYLDHPPIKALHAYKKFGTLVNTFGFPLSDKAHPITGRLHGFQHLGDTRTGRLSSSEPNMHNSPRLPEFRDCFRAPKGFVFVRGDFNQIEVRVAGELSKDPVIREIYTKGRDIYTEFAARILHKSPDNVTPEERQIGKPAVLGLQFGMWWKKFKLYALNQYGVTFTDQEAERVYNQYHQMFRVYSHWCERERSRGEILGYAKTPLGKIRKLEPEEMYTKAVNTPVQGGAAEVFMKALVFLLRMLRGTSIHIVNVVHDEIILLVPDDIHNITFAVNTLRTSMEKGMHSLFPDATLNKLAEPKAGISWADVK